jgi:GRF zinc finger
MPHKFSACVRVHCCYLVWSHRYKLLNELSSFTVPAIEAQAAAKKSGNHGSGALANTSWTASSGYDQGSLFRGDTGGRELTSSWDTARQQDMSLPFIDRDSRAAPSSGGDGPYCLCGEPSVRRTSKTEKTLGQDFFACPKPKEEQCKFFEWVDTSFKYDGAGFGDDVVVFDQAGKRSYKSQAPQPNTHLLISMLTHPPYLVSLSTSID